MLGIGIGIGIGNGGRGLPKNTLAAGAGAFTLTGLDATLNRYSLAAGAGAFALTGTDMTPKSAYVVPAALGTFALTGVAATLIAPASGYTGPGDVVASWLAWYGLRAYNTAYATGSNPAIDIVDQAGANSLTVNILSSGALDVASIAAWVTANSVSTIKLTKVYDQSGNARHAVQATLALMPTIVLSAVGALPAIHFTAASTQSLVAPSVTQAQPLYISAVYERTGNTGSFGSVLVDASATGILLNSAVNSASIFAQSSVASVTAADNVFHKIQALLNGASSAIYLDGVNTGSLNPGSTGFAGQLVLGNDTGSRYLDGYICEAGAIAGNQSASNSALNSNQATYWGV